MFPCFLVYQSGKGRISWMVHGIDAALGGSLIWRNAWSRLSPTGMAIAAATGRGQMYTFSAYNLAYSSSASRLPASTQVAGESWDSFCSLSVCHRYTSVVSECQGVRGSDPRSRILRSVSNKKRRGLTWIGPRRCDSISRGNQNGRGFAEAPTAVGYVGKTSYRLRSALREQSTTAAIPSV